MISLPSQWALRFFETVDRLRFGQNAPRKYERVYANPENVTLRIKHGKEFKDAHPQKSIRCIFGGDWDLNVQRLDYEGLSDIQKLKYDGLKQRIFEGVDWNETALMKERLETLRNKGTADGMSHEADLLARYEGLDEVIEHVRRHGSLASQAELSGRAFRERGGVPLLVDRCGRLLLGRGGTHRFFICKLLEVNIMPFTIVAVHDQAASRFHANRFLQRAES